MKHFIVWSMVLCSYTFTANAINALTGTTYDRIAHQKNTSHPEIKPFVSAYGNLRAEPRTDIITLYFQYNVPADKLTLSTTLTGTIAGETAANIIANGQVTTEALLKLQTGTNANGAASVETKAAVNYVPGHEIMSFFTAIFTGTAATDNTRYIGIFNATDGFAIGYQGTAFGVLWRRNGTTKSWIAQASFNLDPLDGTGPSGFIIDPTKMNIFYIAFGWLGTAPIEFAVMREDGLWIPFHKIQAPNDDTVPTLYNPSLPMRAEVTNAGNTSDLGIHTASWNTGYTGFTKANRDWTYSLAEVTVNGATAYPLVFKNITTYQSKTSTARCRLLFINAAGRNSGNIFSVNLYKNPTWSTAPLYNEASNANYINIDFSVMQFQSNAITAFTVSDPGTLVFSADAYGRDDNLIFFIPNNIFINLYPGDELLVQLIESGGGGVNVKFSIGWEEYY